MQVAPLTIHIMVYNSSVIHSCGYSHMRGAITIQLRQLYTISIFVIPVGICSNNAIAQMFIVYGMKKNENKYLTH